MQLLCVIWVIAWSIHPLFSIKFAMSLYLKRYDEIETLLGLFKGTGLPLLSTIQLEVLEL